MPRTAAPAPRRLAMVTLALALILAAVLPGLAASPRAAAQDTWAPPATVYVERTGHTLDRLFLDLWRQHAAFLGDPVTEELSVAVPWSDERETVQFFQNAAIAYLPEATDGQTVRLLPLGRSMSRDARTAHADAFAPVLPGACRPQDDDCELVARTRHTVDGDFLAFWRTDSGQLLGAPISEPFETDGRTVQHFENGALQTDETDGIMARPLGVAAAEAGGHPTSAVEQPAEVPTYDATLFVAPEPDADTGAVTDEGTVAEAPAEAPAVAADYGPGPQQGGSKEIVISISASALWAYDNGELLTSTLVSTGVGDIPETVTPLGYYAIHTKYDVQDMQGVLGGEAYFVPEVPWVMYFDQLGNAIHGAYWHNSFGTPMSHGCVNLPMDVAPVLYAWADIGTPVTVLP